MIETDGNAIALDGPAGAARRLFRLLRLRPHEFERDGLALRLRDQLETQTCRDALLEIVERTFAADHDSRGLAETVVRCDFRREKARAAAWAMHLSLRHFYRRRSEAFAMLALSLEQFERFVPTSGGRAQYCAHCHQRLPDAPRAAMPEDRTAT